MSTKCFLIDDDEDDQEIFLMALQQVDQNIRCDVAADCTEGLRKLTADISFIPQYIFLDINMPKMNGRDCLTLIRKLDHLTDTQIIMYSTSSDVKVIRACNELGADDFLVKPASLSLLTDALNKIFKGIKSPI